MQSPQITYGLLHCFPSNQTSHQIEVQRVVPFSLLCQQKLCGDYRGGNFLGDITEKGISSGTDTSNYMPNQFVRHEKG